MTSLRKERVTREYGRKRTDYELDDYDITDAASVYWNLTAPELYEEVVPRSEGVISDHGALIVDTGEKAVAPVGD
jgi:ATP-dependent phosphoenolpyruvate carboxykinase